MFYGTDALQKFCVMANVRTVQRAKQMSQIMTTHAIVLLVLPEEIVNQVNITLLKYADTST